RARFSRRVCIEKRDGRFGGASGGFVRRRVGRPRSRTTGRGSALSRIQAGGPARSGGNAGGSQRVSAGRACRESGTAIDLLVPSRPARRRSHARGAGERGGAVDAGDARLVS